MKKNKNVFILSLFCFVVALGLTGCITIGFLSALLDELDDTSIQATSHAIQTAPAATPDITIHTAQPTDDVLQPTDDVLQPTATIALPDDRSLFSMSFNAVDIFGNVITPDVIGEKRVFFVHYWATWCPPCIAEMPDLARIVERYGDDVGFIALLDDYDDNRNGAVNLMRSVDMPANFFVIDAYTPGLEQALRMISSGYVPTTVLIDSTGQNHGQIVGAMGMDYANYIDELLE